MKILRIFSLVVVLHMALIVMLVLQPGCNTVSKKQTAEVASPLSPSGHSGMWVMNEEGTTKTDRVRNSPAVARTDYVETTTAYSEPIVRNEKINLQEARVPTATVYKEGNNHFEYEVKRGDSLWKIARNNDISMKTLMSYNGLTETDRIFPGQTLMVPGAKSDKQIAPTFVAAEKKNEATIPEIPTDRVEKKTEKKPAAFIAQHEESQPAPAPEKTDDLTSYEEFADQPVALASMENKQSGEGIYEVQPGDSLYIIAMQNDTSVEEIRQLNGMDKNLIRVGQKIRIPGKYNGPMDQVEGAESSFSVAFNDIPVEQTAKDEQYLEHTVKSGEFPGLIARKYNMNVADLLHLNDIRNPRMLKVGTTLKVVNPEYMVGQTQYASNEKSGSQKESLTAQDSETEESESDESVDTNNFQDFPIVRIGS